MECRELDFHAFQSAVVDLMISPGPFDQEPEVVISGIVRCAGCRAFPAFMAYAQNVCVRERPEDPIANPNLGAIAELIGGWINACADMAIPILLDSLEIPELRAVVIDGAAHSAHPQRVHVLDKAILLIQDFPEWSVETLVDGAALAPLPDRDRLFTELAKAIPKPFTNAWKRLHSYSGG